MQATPSRLWRRTNAALVLVAVIAAGATANSAHAGTMRYWSCQTAGGTPTTAAGWTSSMGGWNYSSASDSCAAGGALALDLTPQLGVSANTSPAFWRFQAPANTTIDRALVRWGGNINYADYSASVGLTVYRDDTAYDGGHVLENCQFYAGCSQVAAYAREFDVSADRLILAAACGGSDGAVCGAGDRAHLRMYSAGINLVDNASPAAGNISGSALANRTLAGNESLVIPLSDVGVGIAGVEVKLDGTAAVARQAVDSNGGRCAAIEGGYSTPVPCKLNATANLSIPTNVVADGTHQLTATVWDAAGNASTVVSQKIVTDNVAPPAIKGSVGNDGKNPNDPRMDGELRVGSLLTAFDGTWNDATAQLSRQWQTADSADGPWAAIPAAVTTTYRPSALMAGKYLRLAVTATSKEGATTAYSVAVQVGQPSGGSLSLLSANNGTGGDPASGQLVSSRKRTKTRVSFKRPVRVAGKLVDAAGTPIVGAEIDAYETLVKGGIRSKTGTITTDAKGRYSWSPTTRSNRLVELQYSRQKGSEQYQSTQSLAVSVRAGISIRLARRHIGSYGTGIITGRVIVDGFPADGVRVEVFAIGSRKAQSGGTVKTDGNGRFKWKYRYNRIAHGSVALYVKVHRDRDMPALESRSKIVRQRIG